MLGPTFLSAMTDGAVSVPRPEPLPAEARESLQGGKGASADGVSSGKGKSAGATAAGSGPAACEKGDAKCSAVEKGAGKGKPAEKGSSKRCE